MKRIKKAYQDYCEINGIENNRKQSNVFKRFVFIQALLDMNDRMEFNRNITLTEIGKSIGKDHSSIVYYRQTIKSLESISDPLYLSYKGNFYQSALDCLKGCPDEQSSFLNNLRKDVSSGAKIQYMMGKYRLDHKGMLASLCKVVKMQDKLLTTE